LSIQKIEEKLLLSLFERFIERTLSPQISSLISKCCQEYEYKIILANGLWTGYERKGDIRGGLRVFCLTFGQSLPSINPDFALGAVARCF